MPRRATLLLLTSLFTFASCKHTTAPVDFSAKLAPGQVALRKLSPGEYPDFTISAADATRLVPAIDHSIEYLSKPSSASFFPYLDIDHNRALASCIALRRAIEEESAAGYWDPAKFDARIRRDFDVYGSIGAPEPDGSGFTGRVLFTGYYTPIFDASLTRGGPYQWPLYKRPADLVADPATGETKGRKTADGSIVPYYTRAEIDSGVLAGNELCWLTSRWAAYIVTVQGSGRLKLPDGRIYEVGFAGYNGYDYTSPGEKMLADGAITKEQLTLKGLTDYFAAHPEAMDKYLTINQRDVFFAERPGGPFGKLNVPVTAFATIATDKVRNQDVYPRAMPGFVVAPVPTPPAGAPKPYRGFMMDQDAGGAIRASGRCDIFMGVGPEAEVLAGHELNEGKLYYIAVKPEMVEKFVRPTTRVAAVEG